MQLPSPISRRRYIGENGRICAREHRSLSWWDPCRAKLINWGDPDTDRFPTGTDLEGQIISRSPRQTSLRFRIRPHPATALANVASHLHSPYRGAPVSRVADDGFPRLCLPPVRQAGAVQIASRGSCSGSVISLPEHHTTTQREPHTDTMLCVRRLPDVGFLPRRPELHHASPLPHHDRGQHRDLEGQGWRQVLRR